MTSLREINLKNLIGGKISSINEGYNSLTLILENGMNFTISSKASVITQAITPLFLRKDYNFLLKP